MIERTTVFKVGDRTFETLEEAQSCELMQLLNEACSERVTPSDLQITVTELIKHADKVLGILSHPYGR